MQSVRQRVAVRRTQAFDHDHLAPAWVPTELAHAVSARLHVVVAMSPCEGAVRGRGQECEVAAVARRRAPAPCGHIRGRVPSEALLGRLGGLPVGSLHHCNTCGGGTRREHLARVPCANRTASLCSHTGRARGVIRPRIPPRSLLAERGCVPRRSGRTRQEGLRVCGGSQLAQPARGVPRAVAEASTHRDVAALGALRAHAQAGADCIDEAR